MADEVELGWWRASDGYGYPSDAQPGELWTGSVRGPHGEAPPGPGWWLASDYQWYPPDARPGELWPDLVLAPRVTLRPASVPPQAESCPSHELVPVAPALEVRVPPVSSRFILGLGVALIVVGVALLAAVKAYFPEASTALRLVAWSPVAVGSSVTLVGAVRHLGLAP